MRVLKLLLITCMVTAYSSVIASTSSFSAEEGKRIAVSAPAVPQDKVFIKFASGLTCMIYARDGYHPILCQVKHSDNTDEIMKAAASIYEELLTSFRLRDLSRNKIGLLLWTGKYPLLDSAFMINKSELDKIDNRDFVGASDMNNPSGKYPLREVLKRVWVAEGNGQGTKKTLTSQFHTTVTDLPLLTEVFIEKTYYGTASDDKVKQNSASTYKWISHSKDRSFHGVCANNSAFAGNQLSTGNYQVMGHNSKIAYHSSMEQAIRLACEG